MTLAHSARTWARDHLRLDVQRYPASDPLHGASLLLEHLDIDLVIDVGANDGGYASALRRLGYDRRIVSFEPLAEPFGRLAARAAGDASWDVVRCALGDEDGDVVVHVAGNGGASSSVLPMLDSHVSAAPQSAYVRDESVRLRRLDEVLREIVDPVPRRTFLKIDAQGFERAVLDGAEGLFRDDLLLGVQAEMSLVPLYVGQMLWRETVDRLAAQGFDLVSLVPGFTDPRSGRLLQADGVFAPGRAFEPPT
ncbi:MAG: FkbM family methyltransferase [Nocardioides sp.]